MVIEDGRTYALPGFVRNPMLYHLSLLKINHLLLLLLYPRKAVDVSKILKSTLNPTIIWSRARIGAVRQQSAMFGHNWHTLT